MKIWGGKLKQAKDKNIYVCALLCCLIGITSFWYYMYIDGGVFTVADDFNVQEIPFLTAMNHYIKNRTGMWCWNVDLGTQMIGAYSFYNLGSPFVWLSFLFPKEYVPYLTGGSYVLKYMAAGVTAYLYLRIFVRNRQYALLGGGIVFFLRISKCKSAFFSFS